MHRGYITYQIKTFLISCNNLLPGCVSTWTSSAFVSPKSSRSEVPSSTEEWEALLVRLVIEDWLASEGATEFGWLDCEDEGTKYGTPESLIATVYPFGIVTRLEDESDMATKEKWRANGKKYHT